MIDWFFFNYYAFAVTKSDGREWYVSENPFNTGDSPTSLVDNKPRCIGYGAKVVQGLLPAIDVWLRLRFYGHHHGFKRARIVKCYRSKCPSLFEQYKLTER